MLSGDQQTTPLDMASGTGAAFVYCGYSYHGCPECLVAGVMALVDNRPMSKLDYDAAIQRAANRQCKTSKRQWLGDYWNRPPIT